MNLPHSKIKTKGYPITIKSNPDKSEIQTRIELLKKNGYKIDESKVKSWGPNLQKMWSKISSKYITLAGRPYTASVNNNDVTYKPYGFIPFDKYRDPKREKAQSDFVRLLNQLNYIQTPFTNTTLVDDRGKKYQVTDDGGSRFVIFLDNKNKPTEMDEFRTVPRDQAYREEYVGKEAEVLLETPLTVDNTLYYTGYTKEYIRVAVETEDDLSNTIVRGIIQGEMVDKTYKIRLKQ